MVALHLGAWATYAMHRAGMGPTLAGSEWTLLDATCILIAVGCVQTVGVRLASILRGLRDRSAGGV
jgi:hypothetical protein